VAKKKNRLPSRHRLQQLLPHLLLLQLHLLLLQPPRLLTLLLLQPLRLLTPLLPQPLRLLRLLTLPRNKSSAPFKKPAKPAFFI
jgi:hypothetical protein